MILTRGKDIKTIFYVENKRIIKMKQEVFNCNKSTLHVLVKATVYTIFCSYFPTKKLNYFYIIALKEKNGQSEGEGRKAKRTKVLFGGGRKKAFTKSKNQGKMNTTIPPTVLCLLFVFSLIHSKSSKQKPSSLTTEVENMCTNNGVIVVDN